MTKQEALQACEQMYNDMTKQEALQACGQMYKDIDLGNGLFVGTINPQMVEYAINALRNELAEGKEE